MNDIKQDSLIPIPFPNVLQCKNNVFVENKELWFDERREEILNDFKHLIYGCQPEIDIDLKVVERRMIDDSYSNGLATLEEIEIQYNAAFETVVVLLATPKTATSIDPSAILIGVNFHGNHTVVEHRGVRLARGWVRDSDSNQTHCATETDRGTQQHRWSFDAALQRGYSVATFYQGDVMPDEAQLAANARLNCPALSAWAFGLSRVIDFIQTLKTIDR
jgi:hypothetical protein